MLVQCARAAARTNNSHLRAQFFRLRTRRGPKAAVVAVTVSVRTIAYHMMRDGTFYQDLDPEHFAAATRPASRPSSHNASGTSAIMSKSAAPHDATGPGSEQLPCAERTGIGTGHPQV